MERGFSTDPNDISIGVGSDTTVSIFICNQMGACEVTESFAIKLCELNDEQRETAIDFYLNEVLLILICILISFLGGFDVLLLNILF